MNNDHIHVVEQRLRLAINEGLDKEAHAKASVKCYPVSFLIFCFSVSKSNFCSSKRQFQYQCKVPSITQQTLSLFDIFQTMKNVEKNWKLWCCKFAAGFFNQNFLIWWELKFSSHSFFWTKIKLFIFWLDQTYVRYLPTGKETGRFLALDLGGTNFRVLLVDIGEDKQFSMESKIFPIPNEVMTR